MGMNDLEVYMGGVTAEQAIYAGGRISNANKIAKSNAEITREALNLTRAETIHGTNRSFWSLIAIQEQVKVLKQYTEALDSLEAQVKASYDQGLVAKSELLKITVKYNEAQLAEVEIKNAMRIAGMNLARLTGRSLDEPLVAETKSDSTSSAQKAINTYLGENFSSRPELKILQQQRKLASLEKSSLKGEYLPQIGINGGYRYIEVPDLMPGSWSLTLGAGVSIPVFHWGERKHRLEMARINEMKIESKLSDTHDEISLEVKQKRFDVETAEEKVKIAHQNLEQAEEALSEVESSYNAGINTITDLLNAKTGRQRAAATLVEAKAALEIQRSAYLKAVGSL